MKVVRTLRFGCARCVTLILLFIFLLVVTFPTHGAERFPPPEFESGYQIPQTTTPAPRSSLLEYVDVLALLTALIVSSYLVLKKRSRTGVVALSILSLAYFGFYREGCVCAIGSVQNVALGLFFRGYYVPLPVVAFFLLPLLFTLFFGRTFCAAVCPHGAIQDLVLLRPLRVPVWLEHTLAMLAYLYLGAAMLFAAMGSVFIICEYDPFVAIFRRTGSFEMVMLGVCLLVIALFVARPYCRFLCPYGVLLGLLSRVSRYRVTVYPDKCINCRLCEDACPLGAICEPTPDPHPSRRLEGRKTLIFFLALLPILVVIFTWLGVRTGPQFSRSHRVVQVADRIWLEATDAVRGTTPISAAFYHTGQSHSKLYAKAVQITRRFRKATGWFGAWVGLVLGIKLIALTVRRRRTEYEADRATCLACARCYWYCPEEHVRLKALQEMAAQSASFNEQEMEQYDMDRRVTSGQTSTHDADQLHRHMAMRMAIGAALFSVCVGVLLMLNSYRGLVSDPLASQELKTLKAALMERPDDASVKQQIRQLDLRLREKYFRQREFSRKATYLLLAGVVVFLLSAHSAAVFGRKPPIPPVGKLQPAWNANVARTARTWIGGLAGVLFALGFVYTLRPVKGIAKDMPQPTAIATPPDAKPSAAFPTPDEVKKNWPSFRGPGGAGVSAYTNIATAWDGTTGKGIRWKTPVPLPGHNSPILWGERVFLSGATATQREVYCFDANTGRVLWRTAADATRGKSTQQIQISEETGYAAPTMATDGHRVFAIFANGAVSGFTRDGERLWSRDLGVPENAYGYASSLAVWRNLLFVLFDQGRAEDQKSEIIALDGLSGKVVWQQHRPVPSSWSSPIVVDTGSGEQLIACGVPWVIAYNPSNGEEIWKAACLEGELAPSPVYCSELIFAIAPERKVAAIRAGGRGDITKTHIAWTSDDSIPDVCSPVCNGELLFLLASSGTLTCLDVKTGKSIWQEYLDGYFRSSPSLVGDRLYIFSQEGAAYIISATRRFKLLSKAKLGEECFASPAFADGRLYIRGKKNLFCIGR